MDYVLSVRRVTQGQFVAEPGTPLYLEVPPEATALHPSQALRGARVGEVWAEHIRRDLPPSASIHEDQHVVFFVHGFNVDPAASLRAHRKVKAGLAATGFKGVVVSFSWPAKGETFNYLEDRDDARATASLLKTAGIDLFLKLIKEKMCVVQIHVVAHSMGAFVVREAARLTDEAVVETTPAWMLSQVAFVSGDISAESMRDGDGLSKPLLRHTARLTNYSNPLDAALQVSNAKTFFTDPRVGRVGLPATASPKCVNVECGERWRKIAKPGKLHDASASHTWYFDDTRFYEDLCATLEGSVDRNYIDTRDGITENRLRLKP